MIFGPIKLVLKIVSGLLALIVLYFAVTFVQIWMRGHEHSIVSAQAIVVFGTTEDNCRPSTELADRLDHALSLFQSGRAPIIAVTGGRRPGDVCTEAGVSATYLENHGVSANSIVIGSGSDTWQNVTSIIATLRARHVVTVITVTDPFHEYRAMAIAAAQGLHPFPSPVTNSPTNGGGVWRFYLKEMLEVGTARFVGYDTLSTWLHVD